MKAQTVPDARGTSPAMTTERLCVNPTGISSYSLIDAGRQHRSRFVMTHSPAGWDYPNSQDPGLTIGLFSLTNMMPLTMRISDQMNHQARIGMPISAKLSGMPIARYSRPIQKVLI